MAMAAYRRHGRQRHGVICAGGGDVPVIRDTHGGLHGIEAVVDKDLTAALAVAAGRLHHEQPLAGLLART